MKYFVFSYLISISISFVAIQDLYASSSHHSNHVPKTTTNKPTSEEGYDKLNNIKTPQKPIPEIECKLNKKVYGWHPYWYGTSYRSYDFSLLSTVSYFSYILNPLTGDYETIHFWETTPLISLAKSKNTRVDITITNFGERNNAVFLENKSAQSKLINNIIKLLKLRDADGICIDFESIPGSMRNEFSSFIQNLSRKMKSELPGKTLTLALYAIDWHNVFDFDKLVPVVDQFAVMAYDYHTASSKNAGPVAPLDSGKTWFPYNVKKSLEQYLEKGVPASKLLLSVPYYGKQWQTKNSKFPSKNIKYTNIKPYRKIKTEDKFDKQAWDKVSLSPIMIKNDDDKVYQLWYENPESLDTKYKLVKEMNLAGIGIFALGYDNGHEELWDVLRKNFCE